MEEGAAMAAIVAIVAIMSVRGRGTPILQLLSAVTLYNVPGDRGGGPVASATPLMASSSDTAEPQLGGEIGPTLPHLPTQHTTQNIWSCSQYCN